MSNRSKPSNEACNEAYGRLKVNRKENKPESPTIDNVKTKFISAYERLILMFIMLYYSLYL